jgi:co-chaperonin GroES (HSP10)
MQNGTASTESGRYAGLERAAINGGNLLPETPASLAEDRARIAAKTRQMLIDACPGIENDVLFGPILDKLKDGFPAPCGYNILAAVYKGPDKIGSIHLPDSHKAEYTYQGKIGLVLALGPDCFPDEKFPNGPRCQLGDVIMFSAYANQQSRFRYRGVDLFYLHDTSVDGLAPPDLEQIPVTV